MSARENLFHAVIVGGGVAAVEAALALQDIAGDRINRTIVAPNSELLYRPMTVGEPFAYPAAHRYRLDTIARDAGAELVADELSWIDAAARRLHTKGGEEIAYEAVLLAMGARPRARYRHALTVDGVHLDELLHGLVQDIEGGYVKRVAFVVPDRLGWPLPIYELALMTARRAWESGIPLDVLLVTSERAPLQAFGAEAEEAVRELLDEAGIRTITGAHVEVPQSRQIVVNGSQALEVDRIVALPELYGPGVRGLPLAGKGFLSTDPYGRVRGVERVFAAGDITDYPVKHGGVGSQQADAAAESIAALAGLPIEPSAVHPVIRGILLTGAKPRYLNAQLAGGRGFRSVVSEEPTWQPPAKIAARYLAPYLERLDRERVTA